MRVVTDAVVPAPLVAVLEVSGAVLSWTVDDTAAAGATRVTFTDAERADWLWRVVGASEHVAFLDTARRQPADGLVTVELGAVDRERAALEPLRRLAFGHWLRRWWPASERDGIIGLDHGVLDVELAVLTAAVEDYFTDDTFDSDIAELLGPHTGILVDSRSGDPRVAELVRAAADLADDTGLDGWQAPEAVVAVAETSRDDYALAAGAAVDAARRGAIARGLGSVSWAGVPPLMFDAAEGTVDWVVEPAGSGAVATVTAAVIGPRSPNGVAVRFTSGAVSGSGALNAAGRASVPLGTDAVAMTETAAWNHDWRSATATVGVAVDESPDTRQRVRELARTRLARPGDDAYLAEILAAESDY